MNENLRPDSELLKRKEKLLKAALAAVQGRYALAMAK